MAEGALRHGQRFQETSRELMRGFRLCTAGAGLDAHFYILVQGGPPKRILNQGCESLDPGVARAASGVNSVDDGSNFSAHWILSIRSHLTGARISDDGRIGSWQMGWFRGSWWSERVSALLFLVLGRYVTMN